MTLHFFMIACGLCLYLSAFAEQPLTPVRTWNIAVISDMNQGYGSTSYRESLKTAIEDIVSKKTDLVLSTGDMVAGQKKGLNYTAMWDSFHRHVTQPLEKANIPLLPSAGNHDASSGKAFQNERNLYIKTFKSYLPDRFTQSGIEFLKDTRQNYPLHYAMNMGPALLIALDATSSGPLIHDQLSWLEEILKKSSSYKIKIIFGHMPLYPYAFDRAHDFIGWGDANYVLRLEKLLQEHQVTYYLSGHHHVFYPAQRQGKVRYISVPLLGTGNRRLLTQDKDSQVLSPEGFLYLTFNEKGEHSLKALSSPSLQEVNTEKLPAQISLPLKSDKDCKGCGEFPNELFLNKKNRSLYDRLKIEASR